MFEGKSDENDLFKSDHEVRKQYKLCMDIEKREEIGVAALQNTLKQIGGWPVLENADWSHMGK